MVASRVVAPERSSRRPADLGVVGAGVVALGGLLHSAGLSGGGCPECAKGVAILPAWGLPLATALTLLATGLGLAVFLGSERIRPIQRVLLIVLLLPLPFVFAAGAMVGVAPCPGCLAFWIGTAIAASLALVGVRGGSVLLGLIAVATVLFVRLGSGVGGDGLVASRLRDGLRTAGFFRPAAPTLAAGTALPISPRYAYAVFTTQCQVCTASTTGGRLRLLKAKPEAVVLISPDEAAQWVAPTGYEGAARLRDAKLWETAQIDPRGAPELYRVRNGRVLGAIR